MGVKACPPGVGGAVSPFGAVERSTMTPGIGFACLTNGSPAVIVASATALSVNNNRGWRYIWSILLNVGMYKREREINSYRLQIISVGVGITLPL